MRSSSKILFVLAMLAISSSVSVMADEIKVLVKASPGVMQKGVIVGEKLWLVGEDGSRKPAADGSYATNDGSINIVNGKVTNSSYGGPNARPASTALTPGALKGFDPQPDPPAANIQNPATLKGFNPQPDPPAVKPAMKPAQSTVKK